MKTSNTRLDDLCATIKLSIYTKKYPEKSLSDVTRTIRGNFSLAEMLRWMKQSSPQAFNEFETALGFTFDTMKEKQELPAEETLFPPKPFVDTYHNPLLGQEGC